MPGKCSLPSRTESKLLRKIALVSSKFLKPKEIAFISEVPHSDVSALKTDLATREIKDTRTPNLKL